MVGFAKLVARVCLLTLVYAGSARAQRVSATPADSAGRLPRIGLVLSGGSAKGIAHIGVLHVLAAEGIVADVVTGASMGAVIGGLYSIGYSPATLDSIVRGLEWESYFRDAPERRFLSLDQRFTGERTLLDLPLEHGRITLPSGAISGQRISELLSRLTWRVQTQRDFKQFPKPFVAVATDLVTGEAVVLDTGSLAEVMRASMSIPSVFSPVRANGRLLVDGAITRNLPARDAKALGADLLICSDVADPLFPASELHSLVDVLMQTVTIYMNAANEIERPLCDVYIRPNTAGIGAADFERTREWIDRGITAATEVREQLRAIAAKRPSPAAVSAPGIVRGTGLDASHDTVHMSALVIQGVGDAAARTLRRRLRLPENGRVTAAQLDRAVKRAFATELFDNIRYRLDVGGGDTVVVVDAIVREQDRVGIGLRYDDTWQGSLLFTARLRNRIGFGSTTQFDVRLGEQLRIAAQQASVGLGGTPTVVGATAAYDRIPLAIYDGESHVADVRVEVTAVTAFGGIPIGDASLVGVELKGEYMDARTAVATTSEAERRAFPTASVVFRSNTLDRSAFPTSGHLLALRSEFAGGNPSFARYTANGRITVPISRHVSLIGRGVVGATSHDDVLPPHYRFTLGGAFPSALLPETQIDFIGLRSQQQTGAAVTVVGAAIQWEARRDVFVTLRSDLGRTGARLTIDRDDYVGGVGASLGVVTPVGPLEVSAGKLLNNARPRIEVSLGRAF